MLGAAVSAAALALAGCASGGSSGSGSTQSGSSEPLQIAYMSFAVANSYDAPMLDAAKQVASANNAVVTVFDANNDPQAQFTQLQDAVTSGKYDGIITQPIFGAGLVPAVQQAIAAGIPVVNIDQILGSDLSTLEPQVDGLSGNVTFVPTKLGHTLGEQTVAACKAGNLDPCNVGYLYDIKASALDVAIRQGFDDATKGSPVTVVAEGESFFTPATALKAVQDMLQAHPEINTIVGSDQGLQGADQALAAVGKTGQIAEVGFGGSEAAVKGVTSGAWFADVVQAPATEGKLGMQALIDAITSGKKSGGIDPFAGFPNNGVMTKATVSQFTPEWPG